MIAVMRSFHHRHRHKVKTFFQMWTSDKPPLSFHNFEKQERESLFVNRMNREKLLQKVRNNNKCNGNWPDVSSSSWPSLLTNVEAGDRHHIHQRIIREYYCAILLVDTSRESINKWTCFHSCTLVLQDNLTDDRLVRGAQKLLSWTCADSTGQVEKRHTLCLTSVTSVPSIELFSTKYRMPIISFLYMRCSVRILCQVKLSSVLSITLFRSTIEWKTW